MRRLRRTRPETILRKLNREIRREQRIRRAATLSDDISALAWAEERVKVLQEFRERAFGLRLRSYQANKPLFRKGEA